MKYEFKGNFLYYVRMIKRLNEIMLEQAANKCSLSLPEGDVLSFLRENPEFDTARDVALYREVSRAYVSKAIEQLAGKGLVAIKQDKTDRRIQHLKITSKGKKPAEILHKAQFSFYDLITAKLTESELTQMLRSIGKVAANVQFEITRLNLDH